MYKKSEVYIGHIPSYEDYTNSSLVNDVEEERVKFREVVDRNNTPTATEVILMLVGAISMMVTMLGFFSFLVTFEMGALLPIILGALSTYLAITMSHSREEEVYHTNLKIDNILKDGIVLNNGKEVDVYNDELSGEKVGNKELLNRIVIVNLEGAEYITRVYNILGTYDSGRIMNSEDFRFVDELDKREVRLSQLKCKEKELNDLELIRVYNILATDYYLKVKEDEPIEESNLSKGKNEYKTKLSLNTSPRKVGILGKLKETDNEELQLVEDK